MRYMMLVRSVAPPGTAASSVTALCLRLLDELLM
jgi:hypothetical protein